MLDVVRLLFVGALGCFSLTASGEDWPMFGRDKTRNPVSPEKNPPTEWDIESGRNIKWKAKIGSYNFAAPVVAHGMVWVGTNNDNPRDANETNVAGVLMCFREKDGEFLCQHASPAREGPTFNQARTGLSGSPLIEGDRLWFVTTRAEVLCLDIGPLRRKEGPPIERWKLDLIDELNVSPRPAVMGGGGLCSIPASHGDLIYVVTGNGTDWGGTEVPSPLAPALICLNKETGQLVWEDNSPGSKIIFGEWGSPIVTEIEGRAQVVAPQGDGWVRSFDARTGELIWKFDINPKDPKRVGSPRAFFSTAPVFYQNRLYVVTGNYLEWGEVPGRLVCLDPTKTGDISLELQDGPGKGKPNPNSGAIWHFEGMARTMGTMAIDQGLVIAPDHAGFVHCLDARTGQSYWKHDLLSQCWGSPLVVDGKAYVADIDAAVHVLEVAKEKKLVAKNLANASWIGGSPIFANGVLFLTGGDTLYAIEKQPGSWRRDSSESIRPSGSNRGPDAVFVPTPQDVVDRMLALAQVKKEDVVYDLGSGDGRIVMAAAKQYGCRAVGYEIDRKLVDTSRERVTEGHLQSLVRIEHADIFAVDLSAADVIAVFLPGPLLERLLPQFEKLKPGARIVSHQFVIPGIQPVKTEMMQSKEDGDQHRLFLWTTPLPRPQLP